jgi:hypothetical protein
MAQALTGDISGLTFEHVCAVEDCIINSGPGTLHLPNHLTVSIFKKFLEFSYA